MTIKALLYRNTNPGKSGIFNQQIEMGGARSAKRLPEKEIIASEVAGSIFENKGEACKNWNERESIETKPLNANSQVKQWSK